MNTTKVSIISIAILSLILAINVFTVLNQSSNPSISKTRHPLPTDSTLKENQFHLVKHENPDLTIWKKQINIHDLNIVTLQNTLTKIKTPITQLKLSFTENTITITTQNHD